MTEPAPDLGAYASTLQHISLLAAKMVRLDDLRTHAEDQLIYRLATDYRAGRIRAADVYDAFLECKGITARGFRDRWNAQMPDELRAARIMWTAVKYAPDSDGNWRGTYPFEGSGTPPHKVSVVYVLFDEHNVPCYVGSTSQFRIRLRSHDREGKQFVRWLAYPCADRDRAYELEDRLLRQHKPYLNRKASR